MHYIGAHHRQSGGDKQGGGARTIGCRAGFGHRNLRRVPAEKGGSFVEINIAIPSGRVLVLRTETPHAESRPWRASILSRARLAAHTPAPGEFEYPLRRVCVRCRRIRPHNTGATTCETPSAANLLLPIPRALLTTLEGITRLVWVRHVQTFIHPVTFLVGAGAGGRLRDYVGVPETSRRDLVPFGRCNDASPDGGRSDLRSVVSTLWRSPRQGSKAREGRASAKAEARCLAREPGSASSPTLKIRRQS